MGDEVGKGSDVVDGETAGVGVELGVPVGLGVASPACVEPSSGVFEGDGEGVAASSVDEGSGPGVPAVVVGVDEGVAWARAAGAGEAAATALSG